MDRPLHAYPHTYGMSFHALLERDVPHADEPLAHRLFVLPTPRLYGDPGTNPSKFHHRGVRRVLRLSVPPATVLGHDPRPGLHNLSICSASTIAGTGL
jgi:hypothetical protein